MTTSPAQLPIDLVTFDLYDTLIELHPKRWERLHAALNRLDIASDLDTLQASDLLAEDFFTLENGRIPIRDRSKEEQEAFRIEYIKQWLELSGLPSDAETARKTRLEYRAEYDVPAVPDNGFEGYLVFDDVTPTLQTLREHGVKRAVISNADDDVTELCTHMQFAEDMDLIVTSALVGYEKPDERTFRAALEPLEVAPESALHIGDQPLSDVAGALKSGMRAALIDRYQRQNPANYDVPVFHTFGELVDHVLEVNTLAGASA